eukprot:14329571-Ditylum_brightwellii.AAC.1
MPVITKEVEMVSIPCLHSLKGQPSCHVAEHDKKLLEVQERAAWGRGGVQLIGGPGGIGE